MSNMIESKKRLSRGRRLRRFGGFAVRPTPALVATLPPVNASAISTASHLANLRAVANTSLASVLSGLLRSSRAHHASASAFRAAEVASSSPSTKSLAKREASSGAFTPAKKRDFKSTSRRRSVSPSTRFCGILGVDVFAALSARLFSRRSNPSAFCCLSSAILSVWLATASASAA
jgi:hypothetical protein